MYYAVYCLKLFSNWCMLSWYGMMSFAGNQFNQVINPLFTCMGSQNWHAGGVADTGLQNTQGFV